MKEITTDSGGRDLNSKTKEALASWLDEFSRVVLNRDLKATLQLFSSAAEVSVWPSETDLVSGRAEIERFFESLYRQPFTISWARQPRIVSVIGDVAWVATDGED